MGDKQLPADQDVVEYLRERAKGHAPGYDIAIYARPSRWLAIAEEIENTRSDYLRRHNDACDRFTEIVRLREELQRVLLASTVASLTEHGYKNALVRVRDIASVALSVPMPPSNE